MMARPVSVSAQELAGWLGLESVWLEHLADLGELPAISGPKGYVFDPRCLYDWVAERRPAAAGSGPVDITALREVSVALAAGDPIEAVCDEVLGRILHILRAGYGAIFLSDEEAWLRQVASDGTERVPAAAVQGIAIWSAASAEPLLLPHPRGIPTSIDLARDGGADAAPLDAMALPFVLDDRVLGVLVVARGTEAPDFTESDLALGAVIATELALATERSRVNDVLQRRLSIAQTQLESYARDIRELFDSEKQRAEELSVALGEVERTYLATVGGLAAAVEAKDEYTAGHLVRVTRYGMSMLAEMIGADEEDDGTFEYGFLLHDVGKLGIPDRILTKDGPLTDGEWGHMRRHPDIGVRILSDIPFLRGACEIVRAHHERWDGSGYPAGLRGEDIPMGARLFAVADAFDAMTTDRPYRRAMPIDDAIAELRRRAGSQFWPDAVDSLLGLPRTLLEETVVSSNGDPRG